MEVDDSTVVPASRPPVVEATPAPRPLVRRSEEEDAGLSFRERYERDIRELKDRFLGIEPEFDGDDMDQTLTEAERKRGWHYPMTKTQQKKEYGCVVADQQRFLWRLQDGHLDIVEDYLGNPKMKKTIDVNLYDEQGWTPLHYAAQRNYSEIVKVLLDGNANPSLKDKVCGMTAFDMAGMGIDEDSGPNEEVLEVLKSYGIKR
uniref:Uncharacterized protein n=1 Tax=Pyrodinium bahamense TaxID=73915 RepID=A0A7S0FAD7_9DINO|eukprot:CAMPEP_0179060038 /NCGR_PEP_ID=MMETSP0796-20121207/25660_1 /TAXON_ID=73915 /ORGANISM="Pyrodinium bahamense, Strain pbaha01" /LENGTH=202 /DNA_ID=CAMNT_0020756809 /DNA_START=66 /DNA_END=674 /DNA_ORIENTATION=+